MRSARLVRSSSMLLGLVLVAAGVAVSCTDLSPSKERASDVYVTVIRWFAEQRAGDESLKVFIEPRGEGSSINVDVQAEVVTAVEDVAAVRFIDGRDEALGDDGEGHVVVKDDGILIAFGPVPNDDSDVTLELDQYLDETMIRTYRFVMRRDGEKWVIDGETSHDETITPDEA